MPGAADESRCRRQGVRDEWEEPLPKDDCSRGAPCRDEWELREREEAARQDAKVLQELMDARVQQQEEQDGKNRYHYDCDPD